MSAGWNPAALPDPHGRTTVVTGANAGVDFFTSLQLAAAGARIVMALPALWRIPAIRSAG